MATLYAATAGAWMVVSRGGGGGGGDGWREVLLIWGGTIAFGVALFLFVNYAMNKKD